jgi:large subunit ribosomal protein L22
MEVRKNNLINFCIMISDIIAIAKNVRISPTKANIVATFIQGKNAKDSSLLLSRLPKKAAVIIKKVVDSAIANASNNYDNIDIDKLFIRRILVLKSSTLKRFRPISRGRAAPLLKRTSHIRVELNVKIA